jgi:hypothetical protein
VIVGSYTHPDWGLQAMYDDQRDPVRCRAGHATGPDGIEHFLIVYDIPPATSKPGGFKRSLQRTLRTSLMVSGSRGSCVVVR